MAIFQNSESEASMLEGFTLTGGKGTGYRGGVVGGGVYCTDNSSPTLINCTIIGNSHGGLYCRSNSSPSLSNCTITGNSGSGVVCTSGSSPTLTNCTISGNGAGLYCSSNA